MVVRSLSVVNEGRVSTESCSVERCGVQTSMAVSGRRPCSRRRRKAMALIRVGWTCLRPCYMELSLEMSSKQRLLRQMIAKRMLGLQSIISTPDDDAISICRCNLSFLGD